MTITVHTDLAQGTQEWLQARCGLLTASQMKLVLTPARLKPADNDKARAHLYELLAQRLTQYVEPAFVSDDMLRGHTDEGEALDIYEENYAPIERVGLITNDRWGFAIGYSPDALVGTDGLVEVKSRRGKYQVQTILSNVMPDDYLLQVQTGLLVSERSWCDFVSFSAGLPMLTLRIHPDPVILAAIVEAAGAFHARLDEEYRRIVEAMGSPDFRLIPTERRDDGINI
jgi:hypothetical protein